MRSLRNLVLRDKELAVLVFMTACVILVLYITLGQRLFSPTGLQSMSVQVSEFGFLALAMAIAMLTGGIDLSVAAAASLAGIMAALVMSGQIIPVTDENSGILFVLGIVAALVTGLLCGLLNGFLIAKISVPPILATLSTMILFAGIGMAITTGQSVPVLVPSFAQLSTSAVANIPLIFIMMVVAFLVVAFVLSRTRLGRRIYLFGENEVALRFSGVRSERVILMSYALIGILVGIAGIIMTSRANSMRVGVGDSYLLQAILVVVLAGFNPFGGKGRIISLAVGLVLLQLLSTAFNALMFSPYAKNFVWGAILLLVMVLNHFVRHWRLRQPPEKPAPPAPGHKEEVRPSPVTVLIPNR
ncbi:ABC transporter permease [Cryobacterium sp. Y11]|uniref:ABC transporter permease n=1 Tax=Cryobacterium sp. Y11 TaxID=2045016 RepID=UPI000CE4ABA9|nr:ABC transporter permease [Cryobacterium sp. Y11]